jgi:hypothetical protein
MKNEFSQDPQFQSPGSPSSNFQSSESKGDLKQSLREAGDKLKSKSKEAASQVKEQSGKYFDQGKTRTADCMGRFSETLRSTADRFESEQDPNIAHYTRMVAGKLDDAASYVRQRDLSGLRQDTEDLAREHPVLFFGGLFALGLATARFLKASGERLDEVHEEQILEDSEMMTGAVE